MKKKGCYDGIIPFLYLNLRRMKLTLGLMILTVFSSFAADLYSQNTKLSLEYKNEKIITLLREIENQSEYRFFFNEEVDLTPLVSVHVSNAPIAKILDVVFENTGIAYEVIGRQVILRSESSSGFGQQRRNITGTVRNESGEPVPGATVAIKGTATGTITDIDGRFSLRDVDPQAMLLFSFVGMRSQELIPGDQAVLHVVLREEAIGLEEVVAVGYGTQKKVNLTGSVASVSGDDIAKRPVTNVETMLQGRMPGVQIVQNSGEPGNEDVSIRIRGTGTFSSAGSNPLVLIDGVQGELADLNPNNIGNISVLKDAASASIYGSRAANGVILVTTKVGQEGKVAMEYRGNFGIHTPTKLFDLVTNSAEYMTLFNEARVNSGLTSGLYTDDMIAAYRDATDRKLYPNTDWLDLLFSPAPVQNHNLTFSGGNRDTKFNVSLGYVNQEGIMKGFSYEKYNIRLNLTSKVNDKIQFGGNFAMKKGIKSAPRQGATDTFLAAMSQAPTYSPMLADGSGRYTFKAYDFEYNNKNPMAIIGNNVDRNTNDYAFSAQGWVDIQLYKGLKWYTKGAINLDFSKYSDFRPQVPLYNFRTNEFMTFLDVGGDGLIVQDDQNEYLNLYTYLNYDGRFGDGNQFSLQAGYSMEENTYQYLSGYRKEFPSDALREIDAGSPSVQQANGSKKEWALMSFFGRIGYNYKEKYLLEGNIRYDGTSRLAPDSRWGAFLSFSAGWRISEEQFFKNLNWAWLNNVKVRGSYGELGNQNIGLYPYQNILALTGNYAYDDANLSSGVAQINLSNADIKWESTTITDIGLDLTAFQGLNVTFDWYKKRTTDILRISQVTDAVGLGAPTVNDGTMENTGVELNLQYSDQINSGYFEGLNYSAGFNIDHYKNKLVDFGAREISGYYLREEGYEWETFYMLEWEGIFQSEDEITNSPRQFNDATVPGDLKFKNQNGDDVIDNEDRVAMKGKYPAFNYAFNFDASWKGFDLSAQFQGVERVKYFVNDWGTVPFVQGSPPTTEWRDRWTESNPSTSMPRIYWGWGAPDRIRRNSSWYLQDGSYLRLKNLTLGYTLPQRFFQKSGINSFRVYFSGDNLFTITNYPGLDPERRESGSFVNYPQNKIYSFGVNVKF